MSYDWSMRADSYVCDKCGRGDTQEFELNYTYNVGQMFYEALHGDWYKDFSGKRGSVLLPILEAGLADMRERPEAYRAMNPKNGWGHYEGAVWVLETIIGWCREYPDATLDVS